MVSIMELCAENGKSSRRGENGEQERRFIYCR